MSPPDTRGLALATLAGLSTWMTAQAFAWPAPVEAAGLAVALACGGVVAYHEARDHLRRLRAAYDEKTAELEEARAELAEWVAAGRPEPPPAERYDLGRAGVAVVLDRRDGRVYAHAPAFSGWFDERFFHRTLVPAARGRD